MQCYNAMQFTRRRVHYGWCALSCKGTSHLVSPHWGIFYLTHRHIVTIIPPNNTTLSVPNSSSGLIFVKIRAESGRIFSKNPGKIRAKIRAKLKCCDFVVFYDMGHVQTAILPFGKQLHNALNMH